MYSYKGIKIIQMQVPWGLVTVGGKRITVYSLFLNKFQISKVNSVYRKGSGDMSTEMIVAPQTIVNIPPQN